MAGDGGRVPDVSEQRADAYLTGARIVEMLRRAEYIEIDGPGMAAHQLGTVLDVDEDEAAEVCHLLVAEGYAVEHQTKNGTPFWRYRETDDERESDPASVLAALLAEHPDATVAAIDALLTSDEAMGEMENVWVKLGSRDGLFGSVGLLDDASKRRLVAAACRSLLCKAPKEDGDA